jgi:hypothetical protein
MFFLLLKSLLPLLPKIILLAFFAIFNQLKGTTFWTKLAIFFHLSIFFYHNLTSLFYYRKKKHFKKVCSLAVRAIFERAFLILKQPFFD